MDKELNNLKEIHNEIKIPENLDRVIDNAINRKRDRKVISMKKSSSKIYKTIGALAASLVLVFIITVNSSSVFAQNIYKIPVIGQIARMVTFREFTVENDTSINDVKIPNVENVENENVEDLINETINEKVNMIIEEQAKLDAEYKEAFLETGGKEEDYRKIETTVDYKLYYMSDEVISFEIFKYQTLAPAYNENFYYNINLKTGEDITIKDVLGEDYQSIIKESVEKQMVSRMDENPDISYDLDYFKEMEFNEDRGFYMQENGDIVVVFAKYEVAAGYMGPQEFVVGSMK